LQSIHRTPCSSSRTKDTLKMQAALRVYRSQCSVSFRFTSIWTKMESIDNFWTRQNICRACLQTDGWKDRKNFNRKSTKKIWSRLEDTRNLMISGNFEKQFYPAFWTYAMRVEHKTRPVFRYFTPLGPRNFWAPPLICSYSVMFS